MHPMRYLLLLVVICLVAPSFSQSEQKCTPKNAAHTCTLDAGSVCNRNGTCRFCVKDSDCLPAYGDQYRCVNHTFDGRKMNNYQCLHKPIWKPSWKDYVAAVLLFLSSSVAGSSGLGGGGLFVPILFLVSDFNAHEAVPLSKAMIFGGAVANFALNIRKRMPGRPNQLLVDYNIAAFMTPSILAGTSLGVTLNVMLPSWIILVLLAITLCITTWRMTTKGVQKMREELAQDKQEKEALISDSINNPATEERKPLWRLIPYHLVIVLVIIEAFVIVMTLLKGSSERASLVGVKLCSVEFYSIFGALFVGTFSFLAFYAVHTYRAARKKYQDYTMLQDLEPTKGTITWTKGKMAGLSIGSFVGGILAGLVGIGGGMVSSPILLEMGVHPQIVMSTSTFLILFTSSTTSIQYLIFKKLPLDYSAVYAIMTFFSNIVGNLVIDWLIKKYKKTFIVIFIVAGVVGLSALMLSIAGGFTIYDALGSGETPHFKSLCAV
eukprot:TRINITY_DN4452_c0_g1_i4.p1 TRINITY_DN4452_c0_g1~~TRINITY_DN4452_c0_g1_i4.p1  ORF type:complete len:492 (+),score=124.09 TRINITY_DN4452_c0_g1_i4:775-2250(+)